MAAPAQRSIDDLLAVMAALRTPGTGCPWDLEQDFRSIAPYTIEEAYEVADAIEKGDFGALQGGAGRSAAPGRLPLPHGRGAGRLRLRRRGGGHHRQDAAPPPARVRHAGGARRRRRSRLLGAHQGDGAGGEGRASLSPRIADLSRRLRQRGERVGVRGRGTLHVGVCRCPSPLALSPQAGRGDPAPSVLDGVPARPAGADAGRQVAGQSRPRGLRLAVARSGVRQAQGGAGGAGGGRRPGRHRTGPPEDRGGVRRPAVRRRQRRAPSQDRPGGRAALRQPQVHPPLPRHRAQARRRRPHPRAIHLAEMDRLWDEAKAAQNDKPQSRDTKRPACALCQSTNALAMRSKSCGGKKP